VRVVVPYVELHPLTEEALAAWIDYDSCQLEYVDLSDDPILGYGQLVKRLWVEGDDVLLVEQDIEIGPSTIYDFRACWYGWCAAPYNWTTNVGPALGCTRFRGSFIAKYPRAVEEALAIAPHFQQFDIALVRRVLVAKYKEQPHVHTCVVHHSKPLLPDADPEPLRELPGLGDIGNIIPVA
jgi:hypothetical protein